MSDAMSMPSPSTLGAKRRRPACLPAFDSAQAELREIVAKSEDSATTT